MQALINFLARFINATKDAFNVQLSGSNVEQASAQVSMSATDVATYNRAAGATEIEIFCESGSIRIRTDGQACTATTGEPLGAGFSKIWAAASVSIYAVSNSTITEVNR